MPGIVWIGKGLAPSPHFFNVLIFRSIVRFSWCGAAVGGSGVSDRVIPPSSLGGGGVVTRLFHRGRGNGTNTEISIFVLDIGG